jgi:hypothetical protein
MAGRGEDAVNSEDSPFEPAREGGFHALYRRLNGLSRVLVELTFECGVSRLGDRVTSLANPVERR